MVLAWLALESNHNTRERRGRVPYLVMVLYYYVCLLLRMMKANIVVGAAARLFPNELHEGGKGNGRRQTNGGIQICGRVATLWKRENKAERPSWRRADCFVVFLLALLFLLLMSLSGCRHDLPHSMVGVLQQHDPSTSPPTQNATKIEPMA